MGGSTEQEVIQRLGFPDAKESFNIAYPKDVRIDYIFYKPTFNRKEEFGSGNVSAQHFYYDKQYPGLVVSFVDGRARRISLKTRAVSWSGLSIGNMPSRLLGHTSRLFLSLMNSKTASSIAVIAIIIVFVIFCMVMASM